MKVKQVVYVVLGFILVVGTAYWTVNYLVPANQSEIPVENSSIVNPEYSDAQDNYRLNSEGITRPGNMNDQVSNPPVFNDDESQLTEGKENQDSTQEFSDLKPQEDLAVQPAMTREKNAVDSVSAEEQKRAKLNIIRDELKKIASGDPQSVDFNKLDALLLELQEMGDANGVVGGVSIPQLRKIIAQSNKIIETSQNKGLLPGEDKNEKLKEEVQTLQDLQQGVVPNE
ncbi:hypothetical protein [Thiomicrorhabdus sp. Kp2]|uniref:hypothetical protein n=1 Tax=Thiomicrorhabdus sp. Kp2 TaxID=1123518 RepID=UPI00041E4F2C|nr:hypothetical protein [Thiomicrorhabdus sp. Kp2]